MFKFFFGVKKYVCILILAGLGLPILVLGQEDLSQACELQSIENQCNILSVSDCRLLLEKCEKYYNQQSQEIEKDLNKTGQEKKNLQSQISSLQKKIKNLNYQISQSNLIIKDLTLQVKDTESSIDKTALKIDKHKNNLAEVLRTIHEEDQKPVVEILFAESSISGFFDNIVALEKLNERGKDLLVDIKALKTNLEDQKTSLDDERDELSRMVQIQTAQKNQSDSAKKEQEYYLKLTEKEYQQYLEQKKEVDKKAADIRARIFELVGVSSAPTFGEAYEIAKQVEALTGVRPAFLLAVITQESNLGKNVGQCYVKNESTGSGIIIKTGKTIAKVMSPTRDIKPFKTIAGELGRDPFATPVSCPMSYGWGGAMGPAQFIPATWMAYRDRLREINGKPADPWNVKDAFLAAALYLGDYGAKSQTYDGEFNAALSYFAGPGWSGSKNKSVY
ncbi:MAG: lytic murein transglycosylase, partial [bacterium]|nr:lytic murein transglycosylase [bacterium]